MHHSWQLAISPPRVHICSGSSSIINTIDRVPNGSNSPIPLRFGVWKGWGGLFYTTTKVKTNMPGDEQYEWFGIGVSLGIFSSRGWVHRRRLYCFRRSSPHKQTIYSRKQSDHTEWDPWIRINSDINDYGFVTTSSRLDIGRVENYLFVNNIALVLSIREEL